MNPTNLRIIPKAEWPYPVGENWKGTFIQFDGDNGNDYRLFARCKATHGHQPLVDDPHGTTQWVDDPNGREVKRVNGEWVRDANGDYVRGRYDRVRRRTWTQVGGYEQGTMRSRTLANQSFDIVLSDLPVDGPCQLMINDRRDTTGNTHSNMVEWDPNEQLTMEMAPTPTGSIMSREDIIVNGTRNFEGRRTRSGAPYVRYLRKQTGIKDITVAERNAAWEIVKNNE